MSSFVIVMLYGTPNSTAERGSRLEFLVELVNFSSRPRRSIFETFPPVCHTRSLYYFVGS
jgi:hypothetical protein